MIFPFCGIICIIIHVIVDLEAHNFAKVFWDQTLVPGQKMKSFIRYLGGQRDGNRGKGKDMKELFPEWEQTQGCVNSTILLSTPDPMSG